MRKRTDGLVSVGGLYALTQEVWDFKPHTINRKFSCLRTSLLWAQHVGLLGRTTLPDFPRRNWRIAGLARSAD